MIWFGLAGWLQDLSAVLERQISEALRWLKVRPSVPQLSEFDQESLAQQGVDKLVLINAHGDERADFLVAGTIG